MIQKPIRYTISDPDRFAFATFYDADGALSPDTIWQVLEHYAALLAKVERLEAMLGEAVHIEFPKGQHIDKAPCEWTLGDKWAANGAPFGTFDTALDAYESLKGGNDGE